MGILPMAVPCLDALIVVSLNSHLFAAKAVSSLPMGTSTILDVVLSSQGTNIAKVNELLPPTL